MQYYLLNFWSKNKSKLIPWIAIIGSYLLMAMLGIGCPIKFLTGISCAGCGMSRACLSALRLDFHAAFHYHPLWVLMPFTFLSLIILKIKKKSKAFYAILFSVSAVMITVYIFRMLFAESDIVAFSPESGMIYRIIQKLISFIRK